MGRRGPVRQDGAPRELIDTAFHALFAGPLPVLPGYKDGYGLVAPVGSFPKDCSPAGVLDATGDVRELCLDVWDEKYYEHSPRVDPVNHVASSRGSQHCARGGSWGLHTATVSVHERSKVDHPSNVIGYRFAVR